MEASDFRPAATAPEVDLLVAVLVEALEDAAGFPSCVEDGSDSRRQAITQARCFLFEREGAWAESRRTILATLDIEEGYFLRLARRYVAGRGDGSLTARRSAPAGRAGFAAVAARGRRLPAAARQPTARRPGARRAPARGPAGHPR